MTLAPGFKFREFVDGREIVHFMDADDIIREYRPVDPKGFLEMCLFAIICDLKEQSIPEGACVIAKKPSPEEVMAVFVEGRLLRAQKAKERQDIPARDDHRTDVEWVPKPSPRPKAQEYHVAQNTRVNEEQIQETTAPQPSKGMKMDLFGKP